MDHYPEDFTTVTIALTTNDGSGGAVAPSTAFDLADFKIYKNGSATQKTTTNGLTISSPFDSAVGVHLLLIDTSNDTGDSGFWVAGAVYDVLLDPDDETVDGQTVRKWVGKFLLGPLPANVTQWAGVTATDLYTADLQFTRDQANTQDEYTATWFKNGVRQTSGITSPTIQVVKRVDGTDLITSTAMTQVGTTGTYKYDATGAERQTLGEAVLVVVSATIDGSTRSFSRLIGRDSS